MDRYDPMGLSKCDLMHHEALLWCLIATEKFLTSCCASSMPGTSHVFLSLEVEGLYNNKLLAATWAECAVTSTGTVTNTAQ